jgi:hypothetical protein
VRVLLDDNGKLLALAQAEFDVFVTVDRNLAFQQYLPSFSIAVILIAAKSNRIADLIPVVPALWASIPTAAAGQVVTVGR